MRVQPKNKARNKYAEPNSFKAMSGVDKVTGVTLTLMAAIIPLIVKYIEAPTGPDQQNNYITSATTTADMFSYYKSIFIPAGAGMLVICLISYALSKRTNALYNWKKLLTSPLAIGNYVFLLAVVLSSLSSPYKYTVTHGMYDRYESVFILLSYIVIFAASCLFVRGAYQCKLLLCGVLFSCLIIGLIGAFQFLKLDFFMTRLAHDLVIGAGSRLKLSTGFPGMSYSTLYNPNSVGLYSSLLLPIAVFGAVYYNRGAAIRVLFIVCAVLMAITAFGCQSSGGTYGFFVVLGVSAVFTVCLLIKPYVGKLIFLGGLAAVAIIAILFILSPAGARLRKVALNVSHLKSSSDYFFKDFSMAGNTAAITTRGGNIYIIKTKDGVTASRDRTTPLAPVSSEATQVNSTIYHYSVAEFGEFDIEIRDQYILFAMMQTGFFFSYDGNNNLTMLTPMLQAIDFNKPIPFWGFDGIEKWGNGRGFIWSRSLPLLVQRPLTGYGPDAFILVFPQYDIVGKVRALGNPYMIVDKAHNLFIMTGVNTGLVSMLALLFIILWFIFTNFFSIIKGAAINEDKWLFGMRAGITVGVCGYAVAAMTTDSTVSVAPIFWMALGIGAALQRRLARE